MEENYIATQNYYDRQLLFAYKTASDVFLYFSIISMCHNSLFNKYFVNASVPRTVLGTKYLGILWWMKQIKNHACPHETYVVINGTHSKQNK